MPETPLMTVRFRLQEVLDRQAISQSELARLSGVSLVTINAMCNNRTSRVDLSTLDAICKALTVDPGAVLEQVSGRRKSR